MVVWNARLYTKCELTRTNLCCRKWIDFVKGFIKNVLQYEFQDAITK
jgi:hypothetical protein